ncbi:aldo/keto reductase, partial [Proteus mirabilis]
MHPISAVEIELSLYALEPLTNGVAATCAELGIPIIAYSPIGRGFLVSSRYPLPSPSCANRIADWTVEVTRRHARRLSSAPLPS